MSVKAAFMVPLWFISRTIDLNKCKVELVPGAYSE